ncbi:MAG TPA: sulfatase [Eubacteriales bacterium]|nr:sulfatase [Eubacteriales bacterium]
MQKNKPNILFVFSDQHRFCDVGWYGNPDVATPNLDRLANEGVWFNHCYSNCPLCVPARGTLLSSQHALAHGAAANDMAVKKDAVSIAHKMAGLGYDTAYVGKWHLGGVPRDQFIGEERRLGFQYWRGCNCNHEYLHAYYDDNNDVRHRIDGYEPIAQAQLAMDYLTRRKDRPRPWFLALGFGTPHDPYFALPDGELAKYASKELRLRGNAEPICRQDRFGGIVRRPDILRNYAGYYAHIGQIDIQIGRILAALEQSGQMENTMIVYTSDHGDMLGSHGRLNKQLYYDESARVPLLFYWKGGGLEAGRREQLFSLIDVMPTIYSLCGGTSWEEAQGVDCSAAVKTRTAKTQDSVYFYSLVPCHQAMFRRPKSWRAIRTQQYSFCTDHCGRGVALYGAEDELQMHNRIRAAGDAALRLELKRKLDAYVRENDGWQPWRRLLKKQGLIAEWNKSQRFFAGFYLGFLKRNAKKAPEAKINHE